MRDSIKHLPRKRLSNVLLLIAVFLSSDLAALVLSWQTIDPSSEPIQGLEYSLQISEEEGSVFSLTTLGLGNSVSFPWPDGQILFGRILDKQISDGGRLSIRGLIEGGEGGDFWLELYEQGAKGLFKLNSKGDWLLNWEGGTVAILKRVPSLETAHRSAAKKGELSRLHPTPSVTATSTAIALQRLEPQVPASSNDVSLIDLMVVYSGEAREKLGGSNEMEALIRLGVAESNIAYQNSGIQLRLQLVHVREIEFEEALTFEENLNRIKGLEDGFADDIDVLRVEQGADLVCLVTANGEEEIAGLAFTMSAPASTEFREFGYSVIKIDSLAGNFTMAHELAHNMGSQHDRLHALNADGELGIGAFPYSYGHLFQLEGRPFRTIMGVGEGDRVPFFSNPRINFSGVMIGVNEDDEGQGANNALSLNNTARIIASFFSPSGSTRAPEVALVQPGPGMELKAGESLDIVVQASDEDGIIKRLEIFRDNRLLGVTDGGLFVGDTATFVVPSMESGKGRLLAVVHDDRGASSNSLSVEITVRPSGDSFSEPVILEGSLVEVTADNRAASKEEGEPQHTNNPGDNSVWFEWIAPITGSVNLTVESEVFFPLPNVYQGTTLGSIQSVFTKLNFISDPHPKAVLGFDARGGQVYKMAVAGLNNQEGSFDLRMTYEQRPPNDDLISAQVIEGESIRFQSTNQAATVEEGEPQHAGNEGGKSIWYRWTPPRQGVALIEVSSANMRPLVDVYTGQSIESLQRVGNRSVGFIEETVDDEVHSLTTLTFEVEAEREYTVVVDSFLGFASAFDFRLSYPESPANDMFVNALEISGSAFVIEGTTRFASREVNEPEHTGNQGGSSVWYRWRAPVTGQVTFSTHAQNYLPLLDAYRGNTIDQLSTFNRDVTFDQENNSTILQFSAVAFQLYQLAVDGFSGSTGPFTLTLQSEKTPPAPDLSFRPQKNGNGNFIFRIAGSVGTTYVIEASDDLSNWSVIRNGIFTEPTFLIEDPDQGNAARFYRVTTLP